MGSYSARLFLITPLSEITEKKHFQVSIVMHVYNVRKITLCCKALNPVISIRTATYA